MYCRLHSIEWKSWIGSLFLFPPFALGDIHHLPLHPLLLINGCCEEKRICGCAHTHWRKHAHTNPNHVGVDLVAHLWYFWISEVVKETQAVIAQQAQLPQVNIDSYGSGYLFLSSCALAGFIQLHAASLHNYIHMLRRSLGLRCLAESRGRNAHILF